MLCNLHCKNRPCGKKKKCSISPSFKFYCYFLKKKILYLVLYLIWIEFLLLFLQQQKMLLGHSTTWSCECGPCSLSWARKEYMPSSSCSLPRQCFLPAPVLGCMERPRSQAHSRRSLGAPDSHPHKENSIYFDLIFRLISMGQHIFFPLPFFSLFRDKIRSWNVGISCCIDALIHFCVCTLC